MLAWKGFPRRVPANLTYAAGETHLLRNIFANYWCGMHLTCKNISVKPDRIYLGDETREIVRRKSFYVLARRFKRFWCSSFRLRKPYSCLVWKRLKNDMPVLGLAGCHWRKWKLVQVRRLASQSVSPDQMGVFVGSGPKWSAATPCW